VERARLVTVCRERGYNHSQYEGGGRLHLGWKKRIAKGALLGPAIYTAGSLLDGDPPTWKDSKVIKNPREAKDEVPREKRAGYDFVKVYNRLSPGDHRSIVAEAKKCGMQVAGHVPDAVGLAGVLKARQDSIEHLDGYLLALKGDGSPSGKKVKLEYGIWSS
jgi:hypothetical protein